MMIFIQKQQCPYSPPNGTRLLDGSHCIHVQRNGKKIDLTSELQAFSKPVFLELIELNFDGDDDDDAIDANMKN